ncbi:MAG: PIN domain-containing protein [Deltaproteobacteria bacterium]|nr:PIN domain-containing protein [Deltaproteobacteria bacterium]
MIIVDTSVWISVLKDKTGKIVKAFRKKTRADIILFSRFVQIELLQDAKDEFEFRRLDEYLATQYYLEATEQTWRQAARIYFDLRRSGITIRSTIDCCIACIAIEAQAVLLHQDRDFEKIAKISHLEQEFFNPDIL